MFVLVFAALILAGMIALLASGSSGWASPTLILDATMTLLSLAGLALVLKLPWDLYFEARALREEQVESERRGIPVDPDDVRAAAAMPRRLLSLCVALHIGAALLASGASWLSGGLLGYYFAAFFLVSTGFRPMAAFYQHALARIRELRTRARYPREDALALSGRIEDLRHRSEAHAACLENLSEEYRSRIERLEVELASERAARNADRERYEYRADRLGEEMTRAVERLTSDQELLRGLRAMVKLIKET